MEQANKLIAAFGPRYKNVTAKSKHWGDEIEAGNQWRNNEIVSSVQYKKSIVKKQFDYFRSYTYRSCNTSNSGV